MHLTKSLISASEKMKQLLHNLVNSCLPVSEKLSRFQPRCMKVTEVTFEQQKAS